MFVLYVVGSTAAVVGTLALSCKLAENHQGSPSRASHSDTIDLAASPEMKRMLARHE